MPPTFRQRFICDIAVDAFVAIIEPYIFAWKIERVLAIIVINTLYPWVGLSNAMFSYRARCAEEGQPGYKYCFFLDGFVLTVPSRQFLMSIIGMSYEAAFDLQLVASVVWIIVAETATRSSLTWTRLLTIAGHVTEQTLGTSLRRFCNTIASYMRHVARAEGDGAPTGQYSAEASFNDSLSHPPDRLSLAMKAMLLTVVFKIALLLMLGQIFGVLVLLKLAGAFIIFSSSPPLVLINLLNVDECIFLHHNSSHELHHIDGSAITTVTKQRPRLWKRYKSNNAVRHIKSARRQWKQGVRRKRAIAAAADERGIDNVNRSLSLLNDTRTWRSIARVVSEKPAGRQEEVEGRICHGQESHLVSSDDEVGERSGLSVGG